MTRAMSPLVSAAIVAIAAYGVLNNGVALARTQIVSPFAASSAVTVYVGTSGSTQLILWKRVSDGACAQTIIGDSNGLFDNTEVYGSGASDFMAIAPVGSLCGVQLAPPLYNGHYLDLYGRQGNDSVHSYSAGDSWLFGEEGGDLLTSEGPGNLFAGDGNDSVFAQGAFASEGLFGENGSDCLWDFTATASTVDCGAGTDHLLRGTGGAFPMNINCEGFGSCP